MSGLEVPQTQQQKTEAAVSVMMEEVLPEIDRFISVLVERIKLPNKAFGPVGSPSPVAPGDTEFDKCKKSIEKLTRKVIVHRPKVGDVPEQYTELSRLVGTYFGSSDFAPTYNDDRVEFFHRVKMMLYKLTDPSSADESAATCQKYLRMLNVLKGTASRKEDNFKFSDLKSKVETELSKIPRRQAEMEQAARDLKMLQQARQMPAVPTGRGKRKTHRKAKAHRKSRKVRRV